MAVTINSISAPINVTATLQTGGSLSPNTTYYVVVCAKNENTAAWQLSKTGVLSDASIEISFTTTTTELSAIINWNAVSGALAYNVYLSKISNYYYWNTTTPYLSGRYGINNTANTSTTNTYTITAHASGIGALPFDTVGSSISPPFSINKNLGTINVQVSGTETPQSVYNAIVAAGFGSYVYYDVSNFFIKGTLRIASGVTGSLTFTDTNIYVAQGTLLNESTSFTLTIGAYNATTDAATNGCNIFIDGTISFRLTNIKLYASTIKVGVSGIMPHMTIGIEITMGADVKYCNFWGVRNTNTNWSNNSLYFPSMLRAWNAVTITNTYYDSNNQLTYYPTNSCNIFYDSTFKINNSSRFADMAGLASGSNQLPGNFYDCNFKGAYYNSINDLIFNFSTYQSLTGFNFFYSLNGNVLDEDKNLVDGVNIKVYDKDNNLLHDINTASGVIPKTYLKVLTITPTGNGTGPAFYTRTFLNPYTFVFSKAGYETYTTTYDVIAKINTDITLKAVKQVRQTIDGEVLVALKPELGSSSLLTEI